MITRTFLRNLGYHYFIYNFILIHTFQNTALKVRKLHYRVGLAQLRHTYQNFMQHFLFTARPLLLFFFSKSRLTFSFTERIEANSRFLLQTVTSHKNQEKALKIPERGMLSIWFLDFDDLEGILFGKKNSKVVY